MTIHLSDLFKKSKRRRQPDGGRCLVNVEVGTGTYFSDFPTSRELSRTPDPVTYNPSQMLKDIGFLFIAGTIVYDAVTGRVSGRGFNYYTRKEHPVFYWTMTPILMLVAALLLVLGLYDIYRRTFV